MLHQDEDSAPPVEPAEVVELATPDVGRPRSPWEGALERLQGGQEAEIIDVREVFRLTHW